MLCYFVFAVTTLLAQQIGTNTEEVHPPITWSKCTKAGCTFVNGGIVLDANWRWKHIVGGYTPCNETDDPLENAQTCAVEGVDYAGYGIETNDTQLSLQFVVPNGGVGSRAYFVAEDGENYEGFLLKNKEFTFDVDISEIPCGMNAALYFLQMDLDGGRDRGGANEAGATYGTGYCDAQCPKDTAFVNGLSNINSRYPYCCFETDIWEANRAATVYTLHNCPNITGATVGEKQCDQSGCGYNHYKNGDKSYYGQGLTIDTNKRFTVVTQFITDNGEDDGTLVDVRRLYVQDGVVYNNSLANNGNFDSITDAYCAWSYADFVRTYKGIEETSRGLEYPQVLAFSLWASSDGMQWLDAGNNGPCSGGTEDQSDSLTKNYPDSKIYFSKIKLGDIDTTY